MFYAENLSARKCSGSDMLQIYPWIGSLNLFSDGNACSTPPPLLSFCLPAGFNLSQTQTFMWFHREFSDTHRFSGSDFYAEGGSARV